MKPTQIPEVETADYDAARMFMSPHAALRVALANEVRAHDFYDNALAHVTDAKVKELFTELRAEELDHQAQIKKVLDKLPPEDKSNPDDFADERDPVSAGDGVVDEKHGSGTSARTARTVRRGGWHQPLQRPARRNAAPPRL